MATPKGAQHRSLEQRFLSLEARVRELSAAALRRRQLGVTEGDFVVSGGGGVVIQDGGDLTIYHDDGDLFLNAGGYIDGYRSFTLWDQNEQRLAFIGSDASGVPVVGLGRGFGADRPFVSVYGSTVDVSAEQPITLSSPMGTRIAHSTTGSAANCRIETDGTILRVSSSLRYKAGVQDAEIDPAAVLSINGRTWVERSDEGDPDAKRNVGFIAEELHDAGLTEFVEYDDEGRPDAIQYDRMSVGLLAVVKSQQAQMDALTRRLEALEAKA